MESPVTETKAVFKSNLFGSLGAGVFVGPNLIDFSTVFDNVGAKILENLPVFVTVLLLMILYIPFVIICRKYDTKDDFKVGVFPIVTCSHQMTTQFHWLFKPFSLCLLHYNPNTFI